MGRLLADRLELPFTDVAAVIEQRLGKPVAAIFADDGEAVFRAHEEAVTAELLRGPGVLALGGGAVLSPTTRQALQGGRLRVGAPQAAAGGAERGAAAAARQRPRPAGQPAGGGGPRSTRR